MHSFTNCNSSPSSHVSCLKHHHSFSLSHHTTQAEQVANFKVTRYAVDARCPGDDNSEEIFENELKFEKVGPGFCLNIATNHGVGGNNDDWKVNDEVLRMFLQRVVSLAGPTLLARAAKISHDDDDGGNGGSDGEADGASETNESNTPSFRSDRRVVRLMIARYWADRLIEKYNEVQKKKKQETIENAEVVI